jgi:hypothetical protein
VGLLRLLRPLLLAAAPPLLPQLLVLVLVLVLVLPPR